MYHSSTPIKNTYHGSTSLPEIWYGGSKIWEKEKIITYEIDNVSIHYLPSSYNATTIQPNGITYASILGRFKTFVNGEVTETKPIVQLDKQESSPYLILKNDGLLYFDVDTYGTTDMSSMTNPFYVSVKTSYNGTPGPRVDVAVTPNLISSTSVTNRTCSGTTSVSYLDYSATSFTLYNKNRNVVKTTYTSGKYTTSTQWAPGYLYKQNINTGTNTLVGSIGADGSMSVSVTPVNQGSSPIIHIYRLSYNSNNATGYDHFIYMMQKCRNNTSGLHIYYGANNVDGYNVETSGLFYLANNGHTSSTTYNIECDNQNIMITQMNGVFMVEATSSDSGIVTITDNSGNSCQFEINM
jgi:hypothetical protein